METKEDLKRWQSLMGFTVKQFAEYLEFSQDRGLYYIYSGARPVPDSIKSKYWKWVVEKEEKST